jgi:hypothetical protein
VSVSMFIALPTTPDIGMEHVIAIRGKGFMQLTACFVPSATVNWAIACRGLMSQYLTQKELDDLKQLYFKKLLENTDKKMKDMFKDTSRYYVAGTQSHISVAPDDDIEDVDFS